MNEKRKKKRKICFTLYAVSDLPLLCLSSSRQVDGMDDDDDEGGKENRTRPVYICMFKKQLEIIPFFSHRRLTERRQEHKKTEQYMRVKERETERERENGICPLLGENNALELPR
jgi:hypothetical protein